jgi:hypothetical protein
MVQPYPTPNLTTQQLTLPKPVAASSSITPTRKGYINAIAEASFKAIQKYDVELPNKHVRKPTSFKKAGNNEHSQWFQAELK